MDLQKEREAFEQHLTDTGLVEFAGYGFEVDECDEYLHEPTQVAWDSWLIGLNRAKAQAIPDGFVLVPKEPNKQFKNVLSHYLDELWMGEWGCDWDGFICVNGIDPNHVWKIVTDTKAMIEASQDSAND
ncbi:MAG TPA: hypothetical protein GXX13_11545 [Acinetobacter towneri]|nr:hypothetical protein [Acinetobacter towneri]